MSDKTYNFLKFLAIVVLPGLGTLYFVIAQIWDLSNGQQVIGTIAAVNVFLGAILEFSSHSYYKSDDRFDGSLDVVQKDPLTQTYSLNLNSDPQDLIGKNEVIFKVNPQ